MSDEVREDAPKQKLCLNCKEWYDARAHACYLCGVEAPDENKALVTARMNGALAAQVSAAKADAAAAQQFNTARRTNNADLANRPLNNYPHYRDLVSRIKAQVKEAGIGS